MHAQNHGRSHPTLLLRVGSLYELIIHKTNNNIYLRHSNLDNIINRIPLHMLGGTLMLKPLLGTVKTNPRHTPTSASFRKRAQGCARLWMRNARWHGGSFMVDSSRRFRVGRRGHCANARDTNGGVRRYGKFDT